MRRIALWMLGTVTVLVLLFSYHTSTSSRFAASQQPVQAVRATVGPDRFSRAGAVDGDAITTRFGVVQVRISVRDGRIVTIGTLQVPNRDRHDRMINDRAVPILNAQVVERQSAQVDLVSGATLTSQGYVRSLQSAIDRASA